MLIIAMTGVLGYANSFAVPLQLDDNLTLAAAYKNVSGGWSLSAAGASRWLVDATFAANRYLHGFWLAGYHGVNLAIHLATALLVYALITSLIRSTSAQSSPPHAQTVLCRFVPLTTALLFVSHPLQTEAVTYICQRYTSLATFFYLAALWMFCSVRQSPSGSSIRSLWWAGYVLAAIAAMKCKQISITLPVVTILCEALFFQGVLLRKAAFVIMLSILCAIVPLQELASQRTSSSQTFGQQILHASSETENISRSSYFLTEQRVQATYLRLLVLPFGQNLDYDYPLSTSLKEWPVVAALLLHLTLLGCAILLLLRNTHATAVASQERRVALRLAGLGIIWFYGTLAVESSVIPIRDVIYEHRLYLPSIGIFMTISACGALLLAMRPQLRIHARYGVVIIIIALTTATFLRNRVWQSELGLWQDVLDKSPRKARPHFVIGTYYIKQRQLDQALYHFVYAIEREPERDIYSIHLNDAITMAADFEHRWANSAPYHRTPDTVDPAQRTMWRAASANNLGLAYELLNKRSQAEQCYRQAVALNSNLAVAWFNLALLTGTQNRSSDLEQARQHLQQLNSKLIQQLPTQ